jgi:hypothetical protein
MARENFPEGKYLHAGNALEAPQSVIPQGKLFPIFKDSAGPS